MSTTTSLVESKGTTQNKRNELENLIREFQSKLGSDWDKYHESLSLFLVGKLSRTELVDTITPILGNGLRKYHNKLLLLNFSNSLKDGPIDFQSEFASFWNKKASKAKNVRSSQYEKFKQNIMGLSIRERRRIKNITKDSGKRSKLNASITLSRHALLPKIPMIQNKEQQQIQVNNLVQWQQDVVNGINTPIATDNYEIPDYENLSRRVLMTMREYGLTGGLNPQVLEVLLLGLEAHLRNVIESSIDIARYREKRYTTNDILATALSSLKATESNPDLESRKRKADEDIEKDEERKVILNIDDMYNTFEMFPHLIEPCAPKLRMNNVLLENDDMIRRGPNYDLPPRAISLKEMSNGVSKPEMVVNALHRNANNDKQDFSLVKDISNDNPKSDIKNGSDSNLSTDQHKLSPKNNEIPQKTDAMVANSTQKAAPPQKVPLADDHIGTTDELKWLLHELITTT